MKISPVNINPYLSKKVPTIQSTRNPVELFKMMKMYSKERKEKLPFFQAVINSLDSMLNNCKMRIIKDELGNLVAAYTYRLRKNRLSQKSMYIDALVRNRNNKQSKEIMDNVYQDMKNIAKNRKVEELTLFSKATEKDLRKKYEKLGFRKDEKVDVTGAYLMRVKLEEFLSNMKNNFGGNKS